MCWCRHCNRLNPLVSSHSARLTAFQAEGSRDSPLGQQGNVHRQEKPVLTYEAVPVLSARGGLGWSRGGWGPSPDLLFLPDIHGVRPIRAAPIAKEPPP